METYDLIVIGGGPGGYLGAERAGHAGLKVLLIEKRALGGVCLNEGCIPSKALLNSAKIYDYASHGEKYGVSTASAKIDHSFVVERKNKVVKTLVNGVAMQMKSNNVAVKYEKAEILGRLASGLFEVKAGAEKFTAKKLLIASGSEAVVPPIPGAKEGLQSGFVMTNREILDLKEIPSSLTIIGGGVIGLEMASYFNSVGSKVTVVEMLDKIAGPTDGEISKILMDNYAKKGVEFKLSCKVTSIEKGAVKYEKDGKTEEVKTEKVLLSIGRRAVVSGFGLENIGVMTWRGGIKTDDQMKTNISGVFACGDVNGVSMLAHTAYREAEVAVNCMLGKKDRMLYSAIPGVIYTNPEVATVGDTLETAKEKGIDAKEVKLPMSYSGRYLAETEGADGICKLVVDTKNNRLIGAHLITNYASELIYGVTLMIDAEMDIERIKKLVFPHPSVAEIVRETIFKI